MRAILGPLCGLEEEEGFWMCSDKSLEHHSKPDFHLQKPKETLTSIKYQNTFKCRTKTGPLYYHSYWHTSRAKIQLSLLLSHSLSLDGVIAWDFSCDLSKVTAGKTLVKNVQHKPCLVEGAIDGALQIRTKEPLKNQHANRLQWQTTTTSPWEEATIP